MGNRWLLKTVLFSAENYSRALLQVIEFHEVRIRGINGLAIYNLTSTTPSTPTSSGDCTADYTATGSLHVPCVRVPGGFWQN